MEPEPYHSNKDTLFAVFLLERDDASGQIQNNNLAQSIGGLKFQLAQSNFLQSTVGKNSS